MFFNFLFLPYQCLLPCVELFGAKIKSVIEPEGVENLSFRDSKSCTGFKKSMCSPIVTPSGTPTGFSSIWPLTSEKTIVKKNISDLFNDPGSFLHSLRTCCYDWDTAARRSLGAAAFLFAFGPNLSKWQFVLCYCWISLPRCQTFQTQEKHAFWETMKNTCFLCWLHTCLQSSSTCSTV